MKRLTSSIVRPLDRPRDAAVLAHPPEMDGDQERRGERDADAVQHVEADERRAAYGPAADEREAGVAPGVDQSLPSQFEEGGARSLVPQHGRGAGHVRA